MAESVGVRELKNRTSRLIERVERGEILTVTKRGKPVARIVPAGIPPGIARMIADGRLQWSGRKPRLPKPTPLRGSGKTAAEYVAEGRR
jgi:prevent-host-death family protein